MKPGDSQIVSLFADALECGSEAERAAYLDRVCGDDAALRARIEALLAAHGAAGDFMEGATDPRGYAPTTDEPAAQHEEAGAMVGPYKLLEPIGEGGMGVVYMADQSEPVRRRVALKIIKPGMDTKQVIARFEAERQALAMMDHPNIAKVLDAGTTASGRPYFVMELVRGIPITAYCDKNNLGVRERLELFIAVCQAVQHAHQKGIIHRDLKPSNVLVTLHDGQPVPKVIDFGVAKAIHQQLTERTLFTAFAQMVGTPLYMSPEQAEMSSLDVDTRSDIYSLGVLLYELLTGTTPFDKKRIREAAYDEIRRIIREEEPPRPSTRISTLGETRTAMAAHRKVDPARLSQLLRGELDWVVMKALEKDRTRRYETANGFAADIRRYLSDRPVEACPPSAAYRFRKFARRNRVALSTGVLVAVALVAGTLVSTWQAVRATRAERVAAEALIAETSAREEADRARDAEADQRRLAEVQRAEAETQRGEADKQRAAAEANLDRAKQAVDRYFTLVSESQLLDVPGLQPLRKELLDAALDFYGNLTVERADDPALLADLATTYVRVALVNHWVDRNDDAVAAIEQALQLIERLRTEFPDAADEHRRLAGYWKGYRRMTTTTEMPRDPAGAFRLIQRLMEHCRSLAEQYPDVPAFRSDLAALHLLVGDLLASGGQAAEAIPQFESAQSILEELVKSQPDVPEHRADLARICAQLSRALDLVGDRDRSRQSAERALAVLDQLVTDVPTSAPYRSELGAGLLRLSSVLLDSDPDEAERLANRAIDTFEALLRDYPGTVLYETELATAKGRSLQVRAARFGALAEKDFDAAIAEIDRWMSTISDEPPARDGLAHSLRHTAVRMGGNPAALPMVEQLHRRSLDVFIALSDEFPDKPSYLEDVGHSRRYLGWVTRDLGRKDDCLAHFEAGVAAFETLCAAAIPQRNGFYREYQADTILQLFHAHNHFGDADRALLELERALATLETLLREYPDHAHGRRGIGFAHHAASSIYDERGTPEKTEAMYRRAVELLPNDVQFRIALADSLVSQDRIAEAEDYLRESLEQMPDEFWFHRRLAELLDDQGRLDEAEATYRRALEHNSEAPMTKALLADLLRRRDRTEEAGPLALEAAREQPWNPLILERLAELIAGENAKALPAEVRRGALAQLAEWYAARGRWDEAAAGYAARIQENPDDHYPPYQAAFLFVQQGDLDGYRRHCRELLARFGSTEDPPIAERVAKACLIVPGTSDEVRLPIELAERAVALGKDHELRPFFLVVAGLARYRQGDAARAVEVLDEALAASDRLTPNVQAMAHVVKAMALHASGKVDAAREALAAADEICEPLVGDTGPDVLVFSPATGQIGARRAERNAGDPLPLLLQHWHDGVGVALLRREAAAMFDEKTDGNERRWFDQIAGPVPAESASPVNAHPSDDNSDNDKPSNNTDQKQTAGSNN